LYSSLSGTSACSSIIAAHFLKWSALFGCDMWFYPCVHALWAAAYDKHVSVFVFCGEQKTIDGEVGCANAPSSLFGCSHGCVLCQEADKGKKKREARRLPPLYLKLLRLCAFTIRPITRRSVWTWTALIMLCPSLSGKSAIVE